MTDTAEHSIQTVWRICATLSTRSARTSKLVAANQLSDIWALNDVNFRYIPLRGFCCASIL